MKNAAAEVVAVCQELDRAVIQFRISRGRTISIQVWRSTSFEVECFYPRTVLRSAAGKEIARSDWKLGTRDEAVDVAMEQLRHYGII